MVSSRAAGGVPEGGALRSMTGGGHEKAPAERSGLVAQLRCLNLWKFFRVFAVCVKRLLAL